MTDQLQLTEPTPKRERLNLLDECARERVGMGSEWSPFRYEALDGNDYPILITGAIAPVKTRGKNAGRRDWKKLDKSTERRIVITRTELRAWEEAWSVRTGLCSKCSGLGDVHAGWSRDTGNRYATCPVCKGSGVRR